MCASRNIFSISLVDILEGDNCCGPVDILCASFTVPAASHPYPDSKSFLLVPPYITPASQWMNGEEQHVTEVR